MGCFPGHKTKKKSGDDLVFDHEISDEHEICVPPRPVLSAPPSFRNRVKAIQHAQRFIVNSNPNLRSSHAAANYASRGSPSSPLSSSYPLGGRARSVTELGSALFDVAQQALQARPVPMPLPSPDPSPKRAMSGYRLPHPTAASPLSISPNITSPNVSPSPTSNRPSDSLLSGVNGRVYPSELQPLPLPKEPVAGLRSFTYEELSTACQNFRLNSSIGDGSSPTYNGMIKVSGKAEKLEVTVVRLSERWLQGYKEWMLELSIVARLHSPHLCKLVGFCTDDGVTDRLLVYEKLPKGSLDKLLFGGSDSPPLDWPSRMKIAYGAVQGLTTLHDKLPEEVLYRDFRSSNIQVDVDYSSKLSGYRIVSSADELSEHENSRNSRADASHYAPEIVNGGEVSLKSNVWDLGVVLLEILTGRPNMDQRARKEEQNLVKWTKPFLMDEGRLFLIMDLKLQGRFPTKGAKIIADLALQCLQKDRTRRPTMKIALDMVKAVQEMRYTIRFPLKEPPNAASIANSSAAGVSPPSISSLNFSPMGLIAKTTTLQEGSYQKSPIKFDLIESPALRPLIIPPR